LELGVSSGTTTRNHLTAELGDSPRDLHDLEQPLNYTLRCQLPRSFRRHLNRCRSEVAIDLVELPYYGQPHRREQELRRNQAKPGTTYFHCYATLAVVHNDQRYELALTFVQAKVSLTEVVLNLLKYARLLGLRIRRAYIDKGFARVDIFRLLRRHRIPYVIPVPLRGNGLKTLCRGQRSYAARYTFIAKTAEAYTTDRVLVRRYRAGRRGRHGVDWLVCHSSGYTVPQVVTQSRPPIVTQSVPPVVTQSTPLVFTQTVPLGCLSLWFHSGTLPAHRKRGRTHAKKMETLHHGYTNFVRAGAC
jgi:hypothetical protein